MPYRPDKRQYRSFAASNFRAVESEEGQEPSFKVRGYYTTYNDPYELYPRTSIFPAEYEQVDPHALDGCDMRDVVFQFDHAGMVMARRSNGTLTLGSDEHGAWCEAYLGGCEQGRNLFEAIQNGLIDEMSFGFTIASDEDGDGFTTFKDEAGDYHTTITRIARLWDVSAVSRAANPGTDIGEMRKRSYLFATIEADRKAEEEKRLEEERKAAERESLRRRKAKLLQLQSL